MEALDFSVAGRQVTRMAVVKGVLGKFIQARDGDRIGIVVFGSQSFVLSPMTLDIHAVYSLLESIVARMAGDGTAIGDAIGLGVKKLHDRPEGSRVLILMTDGENTVSYALKDEYRSGPSDFWVGETTGPGDPQESYSGSGEVISVFRHSQTNYINPFNGQISASPAGVNPRQLDYVELWERYGTDFFDNSVNNNNAHNWLPNPVNETNGANKNSNLVHICEEARDEAITIYTLGFETTTASTAVMKKCASSHAHHFDVDGNSIDDAFAAIARDIQKLRLVN